MFKPILISAAIGTIFLSACTSVSPGFDDSFGKTVPMLRAQQTVNVDAPVQNQNKSVAGMDGRAARESMDRYYKSFREPPPPPPTFVIGVGGSESQR